jgi:hypothetical protein
MGQLSAGCTAWVRRGRGQSYAHKSDLKVLLLLPAGHAGGLLVANFALRHAASTHPDTRADQLTHKPRGPSRRRRVSPPLAGAQPREKGIT